MKTILRLFIVFLTHTQSTPILSGELDCWDDIINLISSDAVSKHYYSFNPDFVQRDSVIIFSTCHYDTSIDTKITLYDNNMIEIATNDDTEWRNFTCAFDKHHSTLMVDYSKLSDDIYYISVSYYNESATWFYNGTFALNTNCVPISSRLQCGADLLIDSITNDTELYLYTIQMPINEIIRITTCNQYTSLFDPIILLYDSNFNLLDWNDYDEDCSYNAYAATLAGRITSSDTLYIFVTYYNYPYSIDFGDFGLEVLCYSDHNPLKCNEETMTTKVLQGSTNVYPFILPLGYNSVMFTTCNRVTTNDTLMGLWDGDELLYYSNHDDMCEGISASTIIVNNNLTHNKVYNVHVVANLGEYYGIDVFCAASEIGRDPFNISCDVTDADTCYVNITAAELYGQLSTVIPLVVCDPQYPNCVVNVFSALDIYGYPKIRCPSNDCNQCLINCVNDRACDDIHIYGTDCQLLQVNFYANVARSTIFSPKHYGNLELTIHDEADANILELHSFSDTQNIILNVAEDGIIDSWYIYGENITGQLSITCNGYCGYGQILCPIDTTDSSDEDSGSIRCHIDCSSTERWACESMNVYASNGEYGVNWHGCNDKDPTACLNSRLHCEASYEKLDAVHTEWIWNNDSGWQYSNENCKEIAPEVEWEFEEHLELVISVSIGSFILLIVIVVFSICCYKYQREKKSIYITNGLVIAISIGEYDEEPENPEIDGHLQNLDGVEHDIESMVDLFHNHLGYDIYPREYHDAMEKKKYIKTHWTETELKQFLQQRAKYLENNVFKNKKYDGLIVVISCHGIPGAIMTSDYKRFSKLAVHRIFSSTHPESRKIPRLFLFDCCSGDSEGWVGDREDAPFADNGKNITLTGTEKSKNVQVPDIVDEEKTYTWAYNEANPDFQLATIDAANPGFQSKLRSDFGSYVINGFYERSKENLEKKKGKFIHEIFDDIQTDLHSRGKQHPVHIWNDGTRYIRFKRNTITSGQIHQNNEGSAELEMATKMSINNHETKENKNNSEKEMEKIKSLSSENDDGKYDESNDSENIGNIDEMMEIIDELDDDS